jgi:hypothetical protein
MPKPKKGDPELLLVSFCDIVTITTAALFMAMVVVIDQASSTPIYRPTPIAKETTNSPIFYECRNNQLFKIDRDKFQNILRENWQKLQRDGKNTTEEWLKTISTADWGDDYYKIDNGLLLLGDVGLIPRSNKVGMTEKELAAPGNPFSATISKVDRHAQYFVFLVRDDSFPVFRAVRDMAVNSGYFSGWEFLGPDDPLTFSGTFSKIKVQ